LPERTGQRTLQVLSPFHADDGSSVFRLAKQLGASQVHILFTNGLTSFPINHVGLDGKRVKPLELLVGGHEQPLHGKVIRIIDPTREYLLSGSANATNQALWTANNVEACLLRAGPRRHFDRFLPVHSGTPEFKSVPISDEKLTPLSIAWARAFGSRVEAKVMWRLPAEPDQTTAWFIGDREESVQIISRSADNVLRLPMPSEFDYLSPRAIRLEVRMTSQKVLYISRALIAFDEILNAGPEYRVVSQAWSRLVRGDQLPPDEDDAQLLRAFAESHAQIFQTGFRSQVNHSSSDSAEKSSGSEEKSKGDRPVPLTLLDALARGEGEGLSAVEGSSHTVVERARAAMLSAFRNIGKSSLVTTETPNEDGDDP